MDTEVRGVDPSVPPSGAGCAGCDQAGGWWVHLRRGAQCGHVGCCGSSPAGHASAQFGETGHPVMQSFEPGEDWWWDFEEQSDAAVPEGLELTAPTSHPTKQPVPGPAGRVRADWRSRIR